MTGFLSRLASALKKSLEIFLSPAEDPRQTFTDASGQQQALLARVQQALSANTEVRNRLGARVVQVRETLPRLETQARHALAAGREDLARLALQRRQLAVVELQTLETQARGFQHEEQRLALVEQRLAAQIEAFQTRQEVVAARYTAAETQVSIHEALNHLSDELAGLGLALEEAEQNAEHMEAHSAAIDQLVQAGVLDLPSLAAGDVMSRQLNELDLAQTVEKQLAVLKSQAGAGQLPPGW